jgi:peptide/nickel transport system substrate-binding protein
MVTSIFAVLPAFSSQPPLKTDTMYFGTIGQPKNVDPTQAYDTASGELIMNVYDTLLEFGSEGSNVANDTAHKPLLTGNSVNVSTYVASLGATTDVPGIGSMPEVTNFPDGSSNWVFKINTNLVFQPWLAPNGTLITGEHITAADVVYLFQRMVVQDSSNSPEWMFFGPAFGLGSWSKYAKGGDGHTLGTNETLVAGLIQNYVKDVSNASGAYVQFFFQYAAIGMYDIFAQTWSAVPPKQWSIFHGCWDGTFTAGWSENFRRRPDNVFTPLDEHTAASQYANSNAEPAMCGTGPYKFTYWTQSTNEWRIDAFADCVSHPWPGPYVASLGSSASAPTTVIETGVNTWPTRKMEFLAGDFDMAVVNRANMYDLLQGSNAYLPIAGLHLYYNIPTLETDAIFFTFNIAASSKWIPLVSFSNGSSNLPDPALFSDLNVRWAFCQALNISAYISGAWYGEAIHPTSWWAIGLTPTSAYASNQTAWDINEDYVYGNLTAAGITGFQMSILYNTGNDQRRIAVQAIANTFNDINAKHNTHYVCTVASEDWPIYLADAEGSNLPFFNIGWLADFSDADDFANPFMASWGAFTAWQAYLNTTVDDNILAEENLGNTPASPARISLLYELQYEYMQQAISLPTVQPTGRHWERDWVNGYYVNELYPGFYYQDLYKKAPTTYTSISLDVQDSIISTGTFYSQVYIYRGKMNQMYGGGLPAVMNFTVHFTRNDIAGPAGVLIEIALQRYNTSNTLGSAIPVNSLSLEYPTNNFVLTGPNSAYDVPVGWYEDGVLITLPANVTWQPGGYAAVGPGATAQNQGAGVNDTVNYGGTTTAYTTTSSGKYFVLVGDINGDATVDILDAIKLGNSFGLSKGQPSFNPDADLNGDNTVNILDAILLGNHFNAKLVYTTLGP